MRVAAVATVALGLLAVPRLYAQHEGLLGPYPMEREASGTSWQPELAGPWYVRVFPVTKLSLGYVYDLRSRFRLRPGLGASGSLDLLPEELDGEYGRRPASFLVFGRLMLR